jgi:hypothetical protein
MPVGVYLFIARYSKEVGLYKYRISRAFCINFNQPKGFIDYMNSQTIGEYVIIGVV